MGWNYRIMRHVDPHPFHAAHPEKFPATMVWYGLHEVFYNEKNEPNGWTADATTLTNEDPAELKKAMTMMMDAFGKPVLDYHSKKIAKEVPSTKGGHHIL